MKWKPLSSEFLERWLSKSGAKYTLSDSQVQSIVAQTSRCAAYRMKQQQVTTGDNKKITLNAVTDKPDNDYFYAFGWFTVKFEGCITLHEGNYAANGKFSISDIYDWEDPQGKCSHIRCCNL